MTDLEHRKAFENWIQSPPYERSVNRFPDYVAKFSRPGQYKDVNVQLAWESWCECVKRMTMEREESGKEQREC